MILPSKDYAQLVSDVKKGNGKVLQELYDTCYLPIKDMILRSGGQLEDCQEIFQEAMVKFYDNTHKTDFELRVKPSTYLYAIARNLFLQQRRKTGRIALIIDNEDFKDLGEGLDVGDTENTLADLKREVLTQCMNLAKDACRTLLIGKFYAKENLAELAEELGLSPKFVRVKMFRCKQQLKRCVEQKMKHHG